MFNHKLFFAPILAALLSLATFEQLAFAKSKKTTAGESKVSDLEAGIDSKHSSLKEFDSEDVWTNDTFSRDDHKVLVIQDRKYTKSKRFEIGLLGGRTSSSPFYQSTAYGFGAGYHFNEYFGLDYFATYHKNKLTEDGKQVNNFLKEYNFPSSKEFQEPKLYTGAGLIWSPIYGKFAFFRKSIIHFDIFGTLGLSYLKTKSNVSAAQGGLDQGHLGSLLGVGMRIFLSNHYSIRLDVRNTIYRTKFAPLRTGQAGSTLTRSQYQYTAGLYYFFGSGK